jgi:hypothetical protein
LQWRGANVVSFGIKANAAALSGVLGFAIKRFDHQTTKVLTKDHPFPSLLWDDFYLEPGGRYAYEFYPFKGTPKKPDLTTTPVTLSNSTEPLSAGAHDIFFNRGVTGSQTYAIKFKNLPGSAIHPDDRLGLLRQG